MDWKSKNILIAEDEDANFRYLEALLKKSEINITRALTGKEALDIYNESNFDLIIMDIKMPDMNGFEATREIRKKDNKIPIIALTAFAMQNDESLCLDAGCNSYVSKPVRKETLISVLKGFLG